MDSRQQLLGKLIRDGMYVVDEHVVAEAIVLRGAARRSIPHFSFSGDMTQLQIRSFRRAEHARSFRLGNARRRTLQH